MARARAVNAAASARERGGIAVLDKAMSLLQAVAASHHPLTFTELARASGFPKATLHRILGTLLDQGLLRLEPKDRTYRLGLRLLEFAHRVWADFDLPGVAAPELPRLRDATGETVQLAVLDGTEAVVVASEEPRLGLRLASSVGERLALHASAAGKALASALSPGEQRALLDALAYTRLASRTLTTRAALKTQLDLARARGYAIEEEESAEGLAGIAAAIVDHEGRPIGSIGLSGPGFRLGATRLHELAPLVIGAARRISHDAGSATMSLAPAPRPRGGREAKVRALVESRALLGEGPCWVERDGALWWVDILAPAVHRYDPGSGRDETHPMDSLVSLVVPCRSRRMLVALQRGLVFFDPATGVLTDFTHPEQERPGNRYNDGKCDRAGRLWVGSLDMGTAPNRGSLFRVDPDGTWRRMDTGFTVANGIAWSPDERRLYFADSFRRAVYVYDFDARRGEVAHRRPFVEFPEDAGTPDGMAVDAEGFLWVALWNGWTLARIDPEGRVERRLKLPVPRPTSVCFGGPELATLYVTTATVRLPEASLAEAPLSGRLLALDPGVRGQPVAPFGA